MNRSLVDLSTAMESAEVFVDGDWVESKDQDPDGDVRLIQLADVGDGVYIDKSSRFLTTAKARELNCTFLKQGDVLVARMPDPLGRACIFQGTNKKRLSTRTSVLDPNLMAIWPKPSQLELKFLYHWFLNLDLGSITSGSSVPQLNKQDLAPLKIPVPPLDLQRNFSRHVEAVENLKAVHANSLAELDALFAALQYRAFRGEL